MKSISLPFNCLLHAKIHTLCWKSTNRQIEMWSVHTIYAAYAKLLVALDFGVISTYSVLYDNGNVCKLYLLRRVQWETKRREKKDTIRLLLKCRSFRMKISFYWANCFRFKWFDNIRQCFIEVWNVWWKKMDSHEFRFAKCFQMCSICRHIRSKAIHVVKLW